MIILLASILCIAGLALCFHMNSVVASLAILVPLLAICALRVQGVHPQIRTFLLLYPQDLEAPLLGDHTTMDVAQQAERRQDGLPAVNAGSCRGDEFSCTGVTVDAYAGSSPLTNLDTSLSLASVQNQSCTARCLTRFTGMVRGITSHCTVGCMEKAIGKLQASADRYWTQFAECVRSRHFWMCVGSSFAVARWQTSRGTCVATKYCSLFTEKDYQLFQPLWDFILWQAQEQNIFWFHRIKSFNKVWYFLSSIPGVSWFPIIGPIPADLYAMDHPPKCMPTADDLLTSPERQHRKSMWLVVLLVVSAIIVVNVGVIYTLLVQLPGKCFPSLRKHIVQTGNHRCMQHIFINWLLTHHGLLFLFVNFGVANKFMGDGFGLVWELYAMWAEWICINMTIVALLMYGVNFGRPIKNPVLDVAMILLPVIGVDLMLIKDFVMAGIAFTFAQSAEKEWTAWLANFIGIMIMALDAALFKEILDDRSTLRSFMFVHLPPLDPQVEKEDEVEVGKWNQQWLQQTTKAKQVQVEKQTVPQIFLEVLLCIISVHETRRSGFSWAPFVALFCTLSKALSIPWQREELTFHIERIADKKLQQEMLGRFINLNGTAFRRDKNALTVALENELDIAKLIPMNEICLENVQCKLSPEVMRQLLQVAWDFVHSADCTRAQAGDTLGEEMFSLFGAYTTFASMKNDTMVLLRKKNLNAEFAMEGLKVDQHEMLISVNYLNDNLTFDKVPRNSLARVLEEASTARYDKLGGDILKHGALVYGEEGMDLLRNQNHILLDVTKPKTDFAEIVIEALGEKVVIPRNLGALVQACVKFKLDAVGGELLKSIGALTTFENLRDQKVLICDPKNRTDDTDAAMSTLKDHFPAVKVRYCDDNLRFQDVPPNALGRVLKEAVNDKLYQLGGDILKNIGALVLGKTGMDLLCNQNHLLLDVTKPKTKDAESVIEALGEKVAIPSDPAEWDAESVIGALGGGVVIPSDPDTLLLACATLQLDQVGRWDLVMLYQVVGNILKNIGALVWGEKGVDLLCNQHHLLFDVSKPKTKDAESVIETLGEKVVIPSNPGTLLLACATLKFDQVGGDMVMLYQVGGDLLKSIGAWVVGEKGMNLLRRGYLLFDNKKEKTELALAVISALDKHVTNPSVGIKLQLALDDNLPTLGTELLDEIGALTTFENLRGNVLIIDPKRRTPSTDEAIKDLKTPVAGADGLGVGLQIAYEFDLQDVQMHLLSQIGCAEKQTDLTGKGTIHIDECKLDDESFMGLKDVVSHGLPRNGVLQHLTVFQKLVISHHNGIDAHKLQQLCRAATPSVMSIDVSFEGNLTLEDAKNMNDCSGFSINNSDVRTVMGGMFAESEVKLIRCASAPFSSAVVQEAVPLCQYSAAAPVAYAAPPTTVISAACAPVTYAAAPVTYAAAPTTYQLPQATSQPS